MNPLHDQSYLLDLPE